MTDHIGEATKKVIDLDALEKLADEATGCANRFFPASCYRVQARAGCHTTSPLKRGVRVLSSDRTDGSAGCANARTSGRPFFAPVIIKARAFLARNGKGEG